MENETVAVLTAAGFVKATPVRDAQFDLEPLEDKNYMKMKLALSAILAGAALTLQAQEAEGKIKVGDAQGKARVELPDDKDRTLDRNDRLGTDDNAARIKYKTDRPDHKIVQKFNKGTGIIGMEVKNNAGERVGEIQDIVLDLPTGRLSYVVLSVGGFLGIGEKYIAVPPAAFRTDEIDHKLVLNVDKAKVQAAPGFSKTDWPDVENPAWGAAGDWIENDTELKARAEFRDRDIIRDRDLDRDRSLLRRDGDRDKDVEIKGRVDAKDRTDLDNDRTTFKGRVTAVDVDSRTITVSGDAGNRTFRLAEKPTLTLKGNKGVQVPRLTDFKAGHNVMVGFHKEGNTYVAHSVIQTDKD